MVYKSAVARQKVNYNLIPKHRINADDAGMLFFNEIMDFIHSHKMKHYTKTNSGGISIKGLLTFPSYNINVTNMGVEVVLLMAEGMWRFIFTNCLKNDKISMWGRDAFIKFKKICVEYGLDLNNYKISNGEEVKKEIDKPYICLTNECGVGITYDNVHHIDIHSAWPANLCKVYPEFYPIFNDLYENRKTNEENKSIMNLTIGMFQSIRETGASWAQLSKAAINGCNEQIRQISYQLIKSGRQILCYNTDGIWYRGDIFHGEGEGTHLGEWSNDYVNCYARFKSAGAYEFLDEDLNVNIRLRGRCKLDAYKSREAWEWDDLFTTLANARVFYFDPNTEKIYYTEEN